MRSLILILLTFLFFQKNNFGQKINSGNDKLFVAEIEQTITHLENKKYRKARKDFVQLIEKDWELSEEVMTENLDLFEKLKKKKWQWRKVEKAFSKERKGINLSLRNDLLSMNASRQSLLEEFRKVSKLSGHRSREAGKKWKEFQDLSRKNQNLISEILSKNGFLGKDKIGEKGWDIIFSSIKNYGTLDFFEKHLPAFKAAFKTGKLDAIQYAFFVDKYENKKGNPQVFGSLTWVEEGGAKKDFFKIRDAKNINKRRAAIGLGTIEDYAKKENFEYKYSPQKLNNKDFKKFLGGWDLVEIRDIETYEIAFTPEVTYWIEFKKNGRLKHNRDVNICQIPFQASADGMLKFSKLASCTEECCDSAEIKSILNYHKVNRFELFNGVLFLMDKKNQIWEFKRKVYAKQKAERN